MPINPDFDLKKVPLQAAVAYLISLHDNEVDWNLLGLHLAGAKESLPIPDGNYEYGDTYMIGNETDGWHMYVWSRADGAVHKEDYWFPVGQFPKPGPQGPKGDGLEQINNLDDGSIKSLSYYYNGYEFTSDASVSYKDSTTGENKTQSFTMVSKLPIIAGKYITLNKNNEYKRLEVKVDDTELSLDYIKILKTQIPAIPEIKNGVVAWIPSSTNPTADSIAKRNASGDCSFRKVNFEFIGFKDGENPSAMYYYDIYNNTVGSDYFINKTPTNTGTLTNNQLTVLQNENQSKNLRIVYDNQVYYRMHQQSPANRTLNYIHIDSIDDGNGGYKATGKCFSVTVSTRAWKVFDLDFGGSTRTTHNLTLTNSSTGTNIYFSLTNNRTETYEGAPAGLWSALENSPIACSVNNSGVYSAGMITIDGDNFKVFYGNSEELLIEQMQVSITDNMV